jgi:hypothetical protein
MSTCGIVTTVAVLFLVYLLFFRRDYSITKEGFVEYVVYGPPPSWRHHRLWRRKWFRPYAWPPRYTWFY